MSFGGGGPSPEQRRLQREQQEQIEKQKQEEDRQKRQLATRQISAIRRLRRGAGSGVGSGARPGISLLSQQRGDGPSQTLG